MLIDLRKYLPFDMTEEILEKLCFSEVLLISYIPSKESVKPSSNEPSEEKVKQDEHICTCVACTCKVMPTSKTCSINKTFKTKPSSPSVYFKVTAPSDSTLSGSSESDSDSSSSVSDISIEFYDSLFQRDTPVDFPTEKFDLVSCLNTSMVDLKDSIPTGARTVSVKRLGVNRDKLSVFVTSRFYQDGYEVGVTLSSLIDIKLHTLEETETQHMKKTEQDFIERECSKTLTETGYKCESSVRKGEGEKVISQKTIESNKTRQLLMEGAFMVLLRYIAVTKFQGVFKLNQVNIHGDLCGTEFMSRLSECELVNGVRMPVMRISTIKRHPSGKQPKVTGFILTLSGQSLQIHSNTSKYVIHTNPLQVVDKKSRSIEVVSPYRKYWFTNISMFLKYADPTIGKLFENECNMDELRRKAQFHILLNDYFKMILKIKPLDVVSFTSNFFINRFTSDNIPHNPYFDKTFRRVRYE